MGSTASVSKKTSSVQESQRIAVESNKESSLALETSWQSSVQSFPFPVSVCSESEESFYNPPHLFNHGNPMQNAPTHCWWQHGVHWTESSASLAVGGRPSRWRRANAHKVPQDDVSTEFAYPQPLPKDKPKVLADDGSWRAYRFLADGGLNVQKVPRIRSRGCRVHQQEESSQHPQSLATRGSTQSLALAASAISRAESAPSLRQQLSNGALHAGGASNAEWSKLADMGKAVPLSSLPNLTSTEDQRTLHPNSEDSSVSLHTWRTDFSRVSSIGLPLQNYAKKKPKRFGNLMHALPHCCRMVDLGIDGYSVPKKWYSRAVTEKTVISDDYEEPWVESRISRRRREAAANKTNFTRVNPRATHTPKRPKSAWVKAFEVGEFRPVERPLRGTLVLQSSPLRAF